MLPLSLFTNLLKRHRIYYNEYIILLKIGRKTTRAVDCYAQPTTLLLLKLYQFDADGITASRIRLLILAASIRGMEHLPIVEHAYRLPSYLCRQPLNNRALRAGSMLAIQ